MFSRKIRVGPISRNIADSSFCRLGYKHMVPTEQKFYSFSFFLEHFNSFCRVTLPNLIASKTQNKFLCNKYFFYCLNNRPITPRQLYCISYILKCWCSSKTVDFYKGKVIKSHCFFIEIQRVWVTSKFQYITYAPMLPGCNRPIVEAIEEIFIPQEFILCFWSSNFRTYPILIVPCAQWQ